jgi:class 3 adenylate cyclase
VTEVAALFDLLKRSAPAEAAAAVERLVAEGRDHELCRVNALAFAERNRLAEDDAIAAFLHAARIGIFELSWNILCPGCGGVLNSNATLKSIRRESYGCSLCARSYQATLDEMVEATFTVSPRVRRIGAHEPDSLPPAEYLRQLYWGSGLQLPEDYDAVMEEVVLESFELAAGEKAIASLHLPDAFTIVFEPMTHTAQFLDVKGEPTKQRQALSMIFDRSEPEMPTVPMSPGPLRIAFENRTDRRAIPTVFVAGDALHHMLGARRSFLSAKRLLSNQTFRDIHRTDSLDVDQRLKITSLTFLFTDLRGSTDLYDRVGDLAAFDLVRAHFGVLGDIVAAAGGAVVKTIGDAVMATFPTPDRAIEAALRMREAMQELNRARGRDDLVVKIGIHEGSCIAVSLNERQDFFGQTVNIAARVQGLATDKAIFATAPVVEHAAVAALLKDGGLSPVARSAALKGVANEVSVYMIP